MSKLCLNLNHHLGLHINICIIHWRFVHDFLPLYDWTRNGLGGEVFDWYLWQSPLARSRCNGLVYSSGNAMRCGPFVAKYMRKVKIRRLLLVFFKYLRCTLGQRTVHRGWDWNISGTRRSLWPTKNCPTMSEMRPMMKMAAHKNVLLLTSCGLFRPGGKHAWIYGTWQTQKKTKYSSYLQCSLNKIGADIFVLANIKSGCATETIPVGSLKALKSKWH